MTSRVVILTADSMRHKYFFSKFLVEEGVEVVKCFSEITKSSKKQEYLDFDNVSRIHFNERARVEKDFFEEFVDQNFDDEKWNPVERGSINSDIFLSMLNELDFDVIVCYGCSIVSSKVIEKYKKRILNVHLGLSPYYLGSGTNFHPLVSNKPELVGYTLMFIDEGIDTGEIIHQGRPDINVFDNSHHVGCKVIRGMTNSYLMLVKNINFIESKKQPSFENSIICTRKDSTDKSVKKMYDNMQKGMFLKYLKQKEKRDERYPMIQQDFLK